MYQSMLGVPQFVIGIDGMLSVTFWALVHDDSEIVTAPGAVSSDVLSHKLGSIFLKHRFRARARDLITCAVDLA